MNESQKLFARATKVIPGGVNSPVRAFRGVGGEPLFIERGEGPYIFDADGKRYIDYVGSWGPLILGHGSAIVNEAVAKALRDGASFGAPTKREVEFAELISSIVPSMEMVRCVSSGTEATMTAVRLARGYTGREIIIKFNGCYHGHADTLLVKAGSGVLTLGIPGSPGIPNDIAKLTVSIEFNNLDVLRDTIEKLGANKVAAIILEPVCGNTGMILPEKNYLEGVRRIASEHGIVLIFDEVMTGFRVALGGAQARFDVKPDLTTLGKVIGGGLPIAALGGKREIMEHLAPVGPVYQAGTLSGNPLAVAAGIAVLQYLQTRNPYPQIEEQGVALMSGLEDCCKRAGVELQTASCGSMAGFFFAPVPIRSHADTTQVNSEMFKKFFHAMLAEGVYLAPSAFEAIFLSTEHSGEVVAKTLAAARRALEVMGDKRQ